MPSRQHSPRLESEDRRLRTYPSPRVSTQPSKYGGDRSLPSIQDILPDIARPSDNRQDLSQMRSPLSHEPAGPSRSSSGRARLSPPPYQSRSSPVSPNQMNDRYQGLSGYDDRRLPVRSGPPPNREHTSLSASGWPDRQPPSSLAPSSSYGVPAPPQHAHQDRYGARTPDYGGYDRNGGSSLPPPPPPFHSSTNSYSQPQSDRGYANGSAAYSASPYAGDRYRGSPSNHGPAPSLAHDTNAYGRHSMQPNGYPAHQPNTNGYSAHQPNANGYPYSNGQQAVSYEGAEEPAPRRRRGNLPRWVTDYLKAWLLEHIAHPYPTEQEKNQMCSVTGLQMTQISNWFINARRRRTPELTMQAQAEAMLRDHSGNSNSNSD